MCSNAWQYKRERRSWGAALMQANEQPAVGQHAVGMRPGICGGGLGETQALIEFYRRADIRSRDTDLVKASEHARGCQLRRTRRARRRGGGGGGGGGEE